MDNQIQDLTDRLDRLSSQFDEIKVLVLKALDRINDDPEIALARVAKALEHMVGDAFQRLVKESPGTRPLEQLLQRLVKDGHLPDHLAPYATFIRGLGNVGKHHPDGWYQMEDVNVVLFQLRAVLEWYLQTVKLDSTAPAGPSGSSSTSDVWSHAAGSGSGVGPSPAQMSEGRASPSTFADPAPVASSAPSPERHRRPWLKMAAVAVLGVLLLGMAVYVTVSKGRMKMQVDDLKAAAVREPVRPDAPVGGTGDSPLNIDESAARTPAVRPTATPAAAPELIAFYDFNDGKATDRSGHGHHGILSVNPPQFAAHGYQGGALIFDAQQNNCVTIPVDINVSVMAQITMGGWFNSNSASSATGRNPLLSHDNGGFDRALVLIHPKGAAPSRWTVNNGSTAFGGARVNPGQWTFVVMRHDHLTGDLTLDVDGRTDKTRAFFGGGAPRTVIGKNPRFPNCFSGIIDNIFIFKGVLGDDRIADIRSRGEAAITSMIEPGEKDRAGKSGPAVGPGAVPSPTRSKASRAGDVSGTEAGRIKKS